MLCFLVHEHILYLYFFLSLISFANFLYFEPEHIPACINLPLIFYCFSSCSYNGIACLILVVVINCQFVEIQLISFLIFNSTTLLNLLLKFTDFFCVDSLMFLTHTYCCYMQTVMTCMTFFPICMPASSFSHLSPWSEFAIQAGQQP